MDLREKKAGFEVGKIPFYLFAGILLIRLVAIGLMGPMPQDAYYFFYAQHPDLSYFDHPPAIAYLLKLFTWILGKNVFAIKLADSILTALTCMAVYRLALKFFSKNQSQKIIILFLSTLMVSILSLVSTPDTPLLFFWTLSLLAFYKALFEEKKNWWLLAGALMGLGFDSKYTAIFLPLGLFIFLLLNQPKRKLLLTVWPWLSFIIMVLVASPIIIWNVRNHFASFAFQGSQRMHAVAELQLKPKFILGLLGHQLLLLIPVLFISVLYACYKTIKIYGTSLRKIPETNLFLLYFFLPIFVAFLLLSPIYWIKINWMMPAYITGIMLAASYINKKWFNIQIVISFIIHFGLLIQLLFYPVPVKSDDTWLGWEKLYYKVTQLKNEQHVDFVFSADNYKTSAELNLYSNYFIYGQNVIGQNALQFDYIGTKLITLNGKDAIYVDSDPDFKNDQPNTVPPVAIIPYFDSVTQLKPLIINEKGKAVRKFFIYLCRGYKFRPEKAATDFLHN
ncbi:ArnT family glycosyltransferase [Pedobacter miscanthi]|uniref:Glycosyltransferase RgtA/B/C/D-like domain-containing protein n=1 Tax=Pedobacter miscanthi TaxID=2259170 RepID=A0A366KV04_9SPHI|nr:glycosyltransferase family 39 protein [Pedobacter miscanthi]RBQ05471.1 hypothetical protein DRW42_15895 [Pedobacter miscanthi]